MIRIFAPEWVKAMPGAEWALSCLLLLDAVGVCAALAAAPIPVYYSKHLRTEPTRGADAVSFAAALRRAQQLLNLGRFVLYGIVFIIPVLFVGFRLSGRALPALIDLVVSVGLFGVFIRLFVIVTILYRASKRSADLLEGRTE